MTGRRLSWCTEQADQATTAWGVTNTVPLEALGSYYDSSSGRIYHVGLEGDLSQLGDPGHFSRTLTYLGYTTASDPTTGVILGELSATGVQTPNVAGCPPYKYFPNLGIAFEPGSGNFYITRAYAYPFSLNTGVSPCSQPNCLSGIATQPERAQAYKMQIGSISNITRILTGTWTIMSDVGNRNEYWSNDNGSCQPGLVCSPTPLVGGQSNVGVEMGAASFQRDPHGNLLGIPDSSRCWLWVGTSYRDIKTQGDCASTGAERVYTMSLPK